MLSPVGEAGEMENARLTVLQINQRNRYALAISTIFDEAKK